MDHSEAVSCAEEVTMEKLPDDADLAPGVSEEPGEVTKEEHNLGGEPDYDDSFSEAGSDSESDAESESQSEILRYLSQLDGHRKWRGADDKDKDFRDCLIRPEELDVTFEDVHITPDAINALSPILLQLKMPGQFDFGILAKNISANVLLYGPPGTGKTQFVRAFAKTAKAAVLSLTGADFRHSHVGESEKRIQQIFSYARDYQDPIIIFIDEADSIFRSRSLSATSPSHVDDINQFLSEMDGIKSSRLRNLMVIAASNRPFDIDEGILRRLNRRILVGLPAKDDREAILKIHLKGEALADNVDLKELAKITGDYTGSDLRDLVHEAALISLREMYLLAKSSTQVMRNGELPGRIGVNEDQRILQWKHFKAAQKQIRPSPKSDTMEKVREFHNRFGNLSQRPATATPAASARFNIDNKNGGTKVENLR